MMDAAQRRELIVRTLNETTPVSATSLGEQLGVSRQIIVGDVALLRASGHPIRATNRGYVLAGTPRGARRSFFVRHTRDEVAKELQIILNAGGAILDVSVDHRLYGQLTADLDIRSAENLSAYLSRLTDSSALSELTNGWHFHTVEAQDEETLDRVESALANEGFLRDPNVDVDDVEAD
ncbi:transcription repressor NadR [Schaalia sp. ZJ405]|uniref:transcription repressor NadR n=1 Tax=Schaalia sp. ZJ405 TaxID=2709403 RepID=UPI001E460640|nr:transcription repressor NadR [Schaalia sp. ZJ405]